MSDSDAKLSPGVRRLETKAIVVGYAMSRLDTEYLKELGLPSWKRAFSEASVALKLPPATFKNLRDEFDPVHTNPRRGWHKRSLRPSRQRVLDEMLEVSNDALLELVKRILGSDEEAVAEAIDSLSVVTRIAHNVAERLLTGRRAEQYFVRNCTSLVGLYPEELLDVRDAAQGYDFGVKTRPEVAIEVKGMKHFRGSIQFTDREWQEAGRRRTDYWVVIVGGLQRRPRGEVVTDPHSNIQALCRFQRSVCAVWQARFSFGAQTD